MSNIGELNINTFSFFGQSFQEKRSSSFDTNRCKMEVHLKSVEVPAFSESKFWSTYMKEDELENVYDIERDVIKKIKKTKGKEKASAKTYEIDYMYIDLRPWSLSEKIKKIRNMPKSTSLFLFDDLFLATNINNMHSQFFKYETTQRII